MRTSLRVSGSLLRVLLAAVAAGDAASIAAQTSAADGPWSGEASCVLRTRGAKYQEQQTHRWRLTGGEPRRTGDVRHWPAVWSVTGSGSGPAGRWTIDVPETSAPIAIWEIPGYRGNNRLRIASQHGLLVAKAIHVTETSGRAIVYSLQEWTFPAAEDVATAASLAGSTERTLKTLQAWQPPPDAETVETCTFNFTRGAAAISSTSPTSAPSAAASTATASSTPNSPAANVSTVGSAPAGIQQVASTASEPATAATIGAPATGERIATGTTPTLSRTAPATASAPSSSGAANPPASAPTADVQVTASLSPGTPWSLIENRLWLAGGTLWATVTVSNGGPASASGSVISVPPVPGLAKRTVACSRNECPTIAELESGWTIGSLPSGDRVHFYIEHALSPTNGQVDFKASVAPPTGVSYSGTGNNVRPSLVVLANTTDVRVSMPAAEQLPSTPSPGQVGAQVATRHRFRILVDNLGTTPAGGAVLTVPAVPGLQKLGVTCSTGGRGQCPAVTVAGIESGIPLPLLHNETGNTLTFTIDTVATTTGNATMTGTVALPAWLTDSVPGNNSASVAATVNGSLSPADVRVTMAVDSQQAERLRYRVIVANSGPGRADGVRLVIPQVPGLINWSVTCAPCSQVPSVTEFQSGFAIPSLDTASANSVVYTIDSMATAPGTVQLTASAVLPNGLIDPASTNNSASVSTTLSPPPSGPPTADLNVTVRPPQSGGALLAGFDVRYEVEVWNRGPGAVQRAVVTIPAIAGATKTEVQCGVGASTPRAACPPNVTVGQIESGIAIPWLWSNDRVIFTITANAPPPVRTLTATATAAVPTGITDPNPVNNAADLAITIPR